MNFDEEHSEYKGFLVKANPWNLETVERRIGHFGKSLSNSINRNCAYIIASIPSYLAKEFLEYFDKSEAKIYNINNKGD